jgi:Icc-related predicted phosphoesterase
MLFQVEQQQDTSKVAPPRSAIKVLTVSDEIVPTIYHGSLHKRFGDVELILGCGDLPPSYLEFIVSVLNVPCFYVPGNHDGGPEHTDYGRTIHKPDGCRNIDGRVIEHDGLVIGGLGGSIWYNGGPHQYTQRMMTARVALLLPRILWYRQQNGYGVDILITHSPPAGIHDGTGTHAGFRALRWLIDHFPPRYMIHGHIHASYRICAARETQLDQTRIINTSGYQVISVDRVAAWQDHRYNQSR